MNYHLQSLGWTLLHFCWQAGAIALVYWLADAALSKASSQTRYLLALGAMLLMFLGALATFGYEEMHAHFKPFLSDASSSGWPQRCFRSAAVPGRGTPGSAEEPVRLSQLLPWLDIAWSLGVACFSLEPSLVGDSFSGCVSRPWWKPRGRTCELYAAVQTAWDSTPSRSSDLRAHSRSAGHGNCAHGDIAARVDIDGAEPGAVGGSACP